MCWAPLETLLLGTHKGYPYGIGHTSEWRSGLNMNGGPAGAGVRKTGGSETPALRMIGCGWRGYRRMPGRPLRPVHDPAFGKLRTGFGDL